MVNPRAVISKQAILGADVDVGPYAVIEKGVKVGNRSVIGAFAHLKGNTDIGEDNFIGTGAVIGEMPQITGLRENKGKLLIGKGNIIREYVTVHASTSPDKATVIGNNNYLMGFSHIAHDCRLEDEIVVCNGTLIAGHTMVGKKAFLSGNVVVHQFVRIGRLAMIAGLARVNQDIPPFMLVVGNSRVWGVNSVGLKRAQISYQGRLQIKKIFNLLYRSNLTLKKALEKIKKIDSVYAREIEEFVSYSRRGICGSNNNNFFEKVFLEYPYWMRTKIESYSLFLKYRRRKKLQGIITQNN